MHNHSDQRRGSSPSPANPPKLEALLLAAALLVCSCGGSGSSGGGQGNPPPTPAGLAAAAGNAQVSLTWNASASATGYQVKRGTASGGPYTQVAAPAGTSDTDSGLANGTTYFYVVSAVNAAGESANSAESSATPSSLASVAISVDILANRHPISPLVYGVNFPKDTNYITDSGTTLVRWGGNASTRYNWKNSDTSAASDWYFENRAFGTGLFSDSENFVKSVAAAGSDPLMTIGMLPWAAKDASSYSFSVIKYGAQCQNDPFKADAGDGLKPGCTLPVTGNSPSDANIPLLDTPGGSDPPGSVYRSQWVTALAGDFGAAPHLYDMDNEMDIWGGTHRDVHPNSSGYNELRDTFLTEARALKGWDAAGIRFGPVSCCWWFYWNSAAGNTDKTNHGGVDFLPWWLNEVYWSDVVAGSRSLEALDIHAYPDTPSLTSYTLAQKRALALRILRDYWDPGYISESGSINQPYATQIQPLKTIPFRIPRIRAMLNMIYPGAPPNTTKLSVTEWNASLAGEADFSTALVDADAFGILGRERVSYATRWTAADSANPAYQTLKLFRNYDGQHGAFGTISISATHNADPGLFSVYAALSSSAGPLTLMVVNKDPGNAAQTTLSLNGFTPSTFKAYTLSQTSPGSIVASASQTWTSTQSFAPYSATLLVVSGTATAPGSEWDLNPDTIQVPAGGSVTLAPRITSGSAAITLTKAQFDPGYTAGGTISIATPLVTTGQNGAVTITAGSTAGFYHFTVTGVDTSVVTQTQGGWLVVGNPPASLAKTGDNQSGLSGTPLTLTATLSAGSSGGTNTGASIFFTTDGGTLSKRIVPTDGTGNATVQLTLPLTPGTVHVTAEGPYGLGHPVATFTETAN